LEHIRNPSKSIAEINALYQPSKNEHGLGIMKAPEKWFSNYTFLDRTIYENPEMWREHEVLSWFDSYGRDFFEELDIWDVDWGAMLMDQCG
jgi:hypothetical protein